MHPKSCSLALCIAKSGEAWPSHGDCSNYLELQRGNGRPLALSCRHYLEASSRCSLSSTPQLSVAASTSAARAALESAADTALAHVHLCIACRLKQHAMEFPILRALEQVRQQQTATVREVTGKQPPGIGSWCCQNLMCP